MIALRAGVPVPIGDAVLIPVEVSSIFRFDRWVSAAKRPLAVCVMDGGGLRAFDLDGSTIDPDWLRERVPGLEEAVAAAQVTLATLPGRWPATCIDGHPESRLSQ